MKAWKKISSQHLKNLAIGFLLGLGYFFVGTMSIKIHEVIGYHPMVWFPAGIGLAIIVVGGERFWPLILISAMALSWPNSSFLMACCQGLASTFGNVLASRFLKKAARTATPKLNNVKETFAYIVLAMGFSAFVSTTIAVTSMVLMQKIPVQKFFFFWEIWWFSESMGYLCIGATLICIANDFRALVQKIKSVEYLGLLLVVGLTAVFIYTPLSIFNQTLLVRAYILFPLMIWAATRFDTLGVITVNVLVMISMLIGAINGVLPPGSGSLDDRMFVHQLLVLVLGMTGFVLSAAIREKQDSQKLLLKQSNQLKSVFDSVIDGIITINEQFQIESWNSSSSRIFGYESEEVIGQNLSLLIAGTEEGHDFGVKNALVWDSQLFGVERLLSGKKKDGSTFPAELIISESKIENTRYFTGVIRDITDRENAAKELREAKEAAEVANVAKSAFLANMSHEIRTPLGAVLGFAELIVDPQLAASEKTNFVDAIKRNSELLSRVINDILDLSKVEAGKMELVIREVALSEFLHDTKPLLDFLAMDKGIDLSFKIDQNVPKHFATDPLRLRQILINIVNNAIKFTAEGSVQVHIWLEPTHQEKVSQLVFEVKDQGCGISENEIGKLFAPFSQVDVTTKRKHGGTGLGLFLSKRLALLLGGDVTLTQTEQGKGSTFTIKINPEMPQSPRFIEARKKFEISPSRESLRLDGVSVLLADDSPDNQFLISRILNKSGAQVEVAINGKEAVTKALSDHYDIVLMDIQMPTMDGYEALSELRKNGYQGVIVALTAHALAEERAHCLACGFDDHMAKPVNRDELLERIAFFSKAKNSPEAQP